MKLLHALYNVWKNQPSCVRVNLGCDVVYTYIMNHQIIRSVNYSKLTKKLRNSIHIILLISTVTQHFFSLFIS